MQVTINGQVYSDWSQVPPELQQQLAGALPDTDHDGVPDVFQGQLPEPGPHTFMRTSVSVDGKHYASANELPPALRSAMQQAFGLDQPAATQGAAPAPVGPATVGPGAPGQAAPGPVEPGQVVLNGETVDVTADGVAKPEKGLFRRLFG